MAKRVILVSDVSGKEIPDDEQVEVQVLSYPGLNMPVKLDASKAESDRLKIDAKPMALLRLVTSDGAEEIAVDAELFGKSIRGDVDEVLAMAEGLQIAAPPAEPRRRGRRPRGEGEPSTPRAERTDYTADENYGLIHRGKVTDEEAALVRANIDQANVNRERAGQPLINPDDEKDKRRYGF